MRETHFLESRDGQTSQDTERTEQARCTHPLERVDEQIDRSEHGRNLSKHEALTFWKA
jgi:hypothetical protein